VNKSGGYDTNFLNFYAQTMNVLLLFEILLMYVMSIMIILYL
jgi:hypothetical protein